MIGVLSWKRFGVLLILLSILAGISSNAPGMAFNKITKSPCNGDGLPCNTENNGNELGDNLTMAGKATIKTSSNSNGGLGDVAQSNLASGLKPVKERPSPNA